MFRAKTKTETVIEALQDLIANSSLTLLSPGSKARAIIEAAGQVVGNTGEDTADGVLQSLLSQATGPTLDLIAGAYGLQRLPAVSPKIEAADSSLKYYVRAGTFGDINNGGPIQVPAGTQIKADSDGTSIIYLQRQAVTLPAASSEVYFAADEFSTRVNSNVAPNVLTSHNFTGYLDSAFRSLLVTNEKGAAGRPRETDSNLRFRIRSSLTSTASGNLTSVRLAALQIPGVSDVRIISNRAGLGTFDVVVFGISPVVGPGLLQQVQNAVNRVVSVGSRGIAVSSNLVGVSLRARVRFRANTPQAEKNAALISADTNVRRYINDLLPGQSLTINALTNAILSSADAIVDVGLPSDPFEELLIWRQTSPDSTRFSRNLEVNRRIRDDEDLVVEPFVDQPILLLEAA
jgi:uncharacterized phage protein gp47/JayE